MPALQILSDSLIGWQWFLASVLHVHAVAHPSVVGSLMLVRPTQPVEIFGNVSKPLGTLVIRISCHGNPSVGGAKRKRVAKYSDFKPIEGYISETV